MHPSQLNAYTYTEAAPAADGATSVPEISFSDLEFGDQLGEGAFAAVYRGHWKSGDMDVAIKRVPGKINKTEVEHYTLPSMPLYSRFYRDTHSFIFPYRLKFST